MRVALSIGGLAALLLTGCGPGQSPYFDTVTVFAGGGVTNGLPAFRLRSVMLRGNFGLLWAGTNPVAVSENRFYSWSREGVAMPVKRDEWINAGWLTFFEADRSYDGADMDQALLRRTMDWKRPAPGRIEAIRVSGTFARLVSQEFGEEKDVPGRLMGFFVPSYLRGLQTDRYSWWFLDGRRPVVLRVTDFTLKAGRIELDESNDLQVRLPQASPPG